MTKLRGRGRGLEPGRGVDRGAAVDDVTARRRRTVAEIFYQRTFSGRTRLTEALDGPGAAIEVAVLGAGTPTARRDLGPVDLVSTTLSVYDRGRQFLDDHASDVVAGYFWAA
ncbi:hypothetical protein ACWDPV_18160 [Gordonia sp. NPDC003504]